MTPLSAKWRSHPYDFNAFYIVVSTFRYDLGRLKPARWSPRNPVVWARATMIGCLGMEAGWLIWYRCGPMGLRGASKDIGQSRVAELVDLAMDLERRTMELYCRFEVCFAEPDPVRSFWLDMAEHESRHVGALALVKGLLGSQTLRQMPAVPAAAKTHVANLRRMLDRAEREVAKGISLKRAFELTLEIESSEIEDLVLDLLQLLKGAQERERAARTLIHDLSALSLMIERYANDRTLLARADRVIEQELRRHASR